MLSAAVEIGRAGSGPVILILNAGGNDICTIRMDELITLVRADLVRITGFFRNVIIVGSEMVL